MVFLIDFENIISLGVEGSNGLIAFKGLENLDTTDTLIFFYSEKASLIPIATHRKMSISKALIEYVFVRVGGKNALDFQLSTYLGYLVAKDISAEYRIVSCDAGYDYIVDFWTNKNINIMRCKNLLGEINEKSAASSITKKTSTKATPKMAIKETPKSNLKDELAQALSFDKLIVGKVREIIEKYKTKQGVHSALMKEFGSEKAVLIYKAIKPIIKDKKGA